MWSQSILKQDKDLPIPHNQYPGFWYPGDESSQSISNHDIKRVKLW